MELMTVDKSIEKYARFFDSGDNWIDTLNRLLKFWSNKGVLDICNYSVSQDTLYLNEIQKKLELSQDVEEWFIEYSGKINLLISFLLASAEEDSDFQHTNKMTQKTENNIIAFRKILCRLNREYGQKAENALIREDL